KPLGVVLTSATMTTRDGGGAAVRNGDAGRPGDRAKPQAVDPFRHIKERLGCAEARTLQLGSPFDYERQAELWVDGSLPDPGDRALLQRLYPAVLEHLDRSDGGAFVLFTSYDLLRRVAQQLRPHLEQRGMPVLVQGDGVDRSQLLELF